MVEIKIKKIHPKAIIPKYANEGDAGMDVIAVDRVITDKYVQYHTGLSFEMPEGYGCFIFPRSSISKKDLVLCNSVGILDSGYRGELLLRFQKMGDDIYDIGDKIGQIVILPHPIVEFKEVEEMKDSVRGEGGFGSTGV